MRTFNARLRNRSLPLMTAWLAALALVAAACGGGTSDTSENGGEPARDESLTFAIQFGFNSLDPHRTPNPQGDAIWMRPVYDRLLVVGRDADGNAELQPQLATSYEVADDGSSITLDLRDDVDFQDGTHFDAEAVRANLERARGTESTVASVLDSVESVEVVDPTRVVVHLSEPDPAFLWSLAVGTTGMMISPAAFDTDLDEVPVGSGPFRLVSAAKDADSVYERWDEHWDPEAALVQRLTLSTVLDVNARFSGTRAGDYDAAFLVPPHDTRARDLEDEGFHWLQELGPISNGILLNTGVEPFDDVRVRRAVAMSIDKEQVAEQLAAGISPAVDQPFHAGFVGHDPDVEGLPFDLDEARDLVEEAGAEGASVTIIQQAPQEPQTSMALVVQEAMNDIGLEAEILPLSPTEARATWREGGEHAMVGPMINGVDPAETLSTSYLGGADMPGPAPRELVDMADEAVALPFGSAERETAYQEIGAYLVENPIHVPVLQFSSVILARPEVVGSENLMVLQIGQLDFRGVGVAAS